MPYGIPNEKPEQTKWMEKCVLSVRKENPDYKEDRIISICKAQLKKNNWKVPSSSSELSMRDELYDLEKKIREAIDGSSVLKESNGPWISDIFDDYVIIEQNNKLFKAYWSISGDDITINWDSAIEVTRVITYEPVKTTKSSSGRVVTYGGITA